MGCVPAARQIDGEGPDPFLPAKSYGWLLHRVRVPLRALLGRDMDTAYLIIIAGVTGAIGLVLFTIHLLQGARQSQTLARIALAMERDEHFMTSARDMTE